MLHNYTNDISLRDHAAAERPTSLAEIADSGAVGGARVDPVRLPVDVAADGQRHTRTGVELHPGGESRHGTRQHRHCNRTQGLLLSS